jgi:DNA-directed RNA polymerase beta subunit
MMEDINIFKLLKNTSTSGDNSELYPKKIYEDIEDVKNDNLTKHDIVSIISVYIEQMGLISHNIEGFDDLTENGIGRIMTEQFDINKVFKNIRTQTPQDLLRDSYQVMFKFHNVKVGMPIYTTYSACQFSYLFPSRARLTGLPYAGQITLSATVTIRANYKNGQVEEKVAEIASFPIGSFPIMVGSNRCHLKNMTKSGLKEIGEDPTDMGGYFIMKNNEYAVLGLENIRYNSIHTHIVGKKSNEAIRTEFLSQPGGAFENSSQIKIRYMTNGQINIEINSTKLSKKRLPFYILYRLFGMTSDKDIANTIVFDVNDNSLITQNLLQIIHTAFHLADENFKPLIDVLERRQIIQLTAERVHKYIQDNISYRNNDNAIQYANEDLLKTLDLIFLPHMGKSAESRIRKLKFLGLMIRKTLLVHLKILPPTDRDSYAGKRVHGSGVSLAKALKTHFNIIHIKSILGAISRELKNNPWESITENTIIDTFKNSLTASDLNKAMEQSITSGNKTIVIRRQAATNRVSSNQIERKNILNFYSALRTVATQNSGNASKQTERADKMRRVHPTYLGFICIIQSAESGESVGMQKQLAITAGICSAGDSVAMKLYLLSDPDVYILDDVSLDRIPKENLSFIYVDGELIGYCKNAHLLVNRYRLLRREGRIVDPYTTIYWKSITNEVEFWLDVGRLKRPLLIVDNNLEKFDEACKQAFNNKKPLPDSIQFTQNIRLTKEHVVKLISGEIKFIDLVEDGIFEYITPEEQENCLIAESIDELFRNKHNLYLRYTHCEMEQAILGLTALISPYANHTQPARVTMSTAHSRQAGGWYALNYPFRLDKNRFFQFYNEIPLVKTITHKFIPPNGANIIIAYTSYGGDNQEDSAIVNQASSDRGLFAGLFFKYEMIELENGEKFCNPDALTTKNMKPNASYEKLVNGFIKVGSTIEFGDVYIGRVAKINRGKMAGNNYLYTDRSIVYRLQEPAYVEQVIETRGANDEQFGIVKLRYNRPLRTGDKMSSRSGNKSIVARMVQQSDMPFTQSGMVPDVITNTNSFPSRMSIGQLLETTVGNICAQKGSLSDGTAFLPVDHEAIVDEMIKYGFRFNGKERMYNGMTGEYFDSAIFIGPVAGQRLQKFVLDDEQSVAGSCPTDATTGQPLGGKSVQGGLRMGEMETWALESHGSMFNLYEKHHIDSDGRVLYVCRRCGNSAVYNEFRDIYQCRICKEFADIAAIESTKTANLMREELAASNVEMTIGLKRRQFEKYG